MELGIEQLVPKVPDLMAEHRDLMIRQMAARLGVPADMAEELVAGPLAQEAAVAALPRMAEQAAASRQAVIEARAKEASKTRVVPPDMVAHLIVGRLPTEDAVKAIDCFVETGIYRSHGVSWQV